MAIAKTWEVNTCKRDVSDGYITKVIYRIKATEDGVELKEARVTGEVTFEKPSSLPSDFIPYDTSIKKPDAVTVLGWVKTALGDEVASIETAMDNAVALIKTPVQATGVPW